MTSPDSGVQTNPTVWDESYRPASAYTPEVTILIPGPEGPVGPQGPQGNGGPEGPQGPQGNMGPKGDKGDTGANGTSVTIKGTVANQAALPGGQTAANNGDGYITADTGNLWVWAVNQYNNVGLVRGPAGPAGNTGPAGVKGDQGIAGPTGPEGPVGPQGPPGTNGTGGEAGNGLPVAGLAGDILSKSTDDNYAVEWSKRWPLGCSENPVTDVNAARPVGIPSVYWRTATRPVNALDNDWIYLPDAAAAPTFTYQQEFLTSIGGYVALLNAGNVTWDSASTATDSTGGSIKWQCTTAGTMIIKATGADLATVSPSTNYRLSIKYRNLGSSSAKEGTTQLFYYQDKVNLVESTPSSAIGGSVSVLTGGAYYEMIYDFTTPANCTAIEIRLRMLSGVINEFYGADAIRLSVR